MYKVKVDEKLLCFTGSVNGMEYVTDPDVKLVVNGVDSFSFAIYPQHPLYKEIACKVSRVKIWRDSKLLFYGEVTGYSQDMYGIRTYDCEGALAWLNDLHFAYSISGATPKDVLYWYIKMYNQKLRDKSKSFELGDVTVHKAMTQDGTEGTIARSSGVYPSFWEEIQDKLLNSFGGILRVRYVGSDTCAGYIDWLAIPSGTCSQDVRYAKNLLNCDWAYDCTSIATAVVPLGKRKDSSGDNEVRLTIDKADDDDATFMIQYMTGTDDLVKSGNMVYSKSRMEKYGLIQQAVTFDDTTDAGTLAYQGAVWLRQNGKAASTIRAEAIDLADIDESVEHFTHGDYVRTKLPGDSAESLFPITAIEIPIAAPENAKLTVGTQESGITSGSGGQGGGSIADAGSGADAMAHTHSNKGVLDKITEQDYADFKGAVNKAHIHANKDTLDKIDETAWLTVYGQSHRHDNKEVLDRITAQDYASFKASANKAHVHDNKGTLDKITDVGWNTVYGYTHSHDNKAVLDKTTASYTAADKKKLDGMDLSKYLPLHGTADQSKALSNGSMRYGWCVNNAANANSGYRWFRIGTMTASKNGYDTETLYVHICNGNNIYGVIGVYTRTDSAGTGIENMRVSWLVRDSSPHHAQFKLVGIASSTGVKFELWCYTSARWYQTAYYVIADLVLTGGLSNRWVLETHGDGDAKNATTVGTTSVTDVDLSYAAKAKEADTLTDSGWVDVSNFKVDISSFSQITTSFRKYGDIVFIRGRVQPKSNMTSISLCSTTSTSLTGITPNHSVKGVGVSTDGLTPFMVNITTSPANSVILKGNFSANKIYDFEFSYIK